MNRYINRETLMKLNNKVTYISVEYIFVNGERKYKQADILDFLRERYKIHVLVEPMYESNLVDQVSNVAMKIQGYGMRISTPFMYSGSSIGDVADTYEEAIEKGILEAIKLIPSK